MSHIAEPPPQHLGRHIGESQHCVALVRHATGLGPTSTWRRGELVRGADLPRWTAIATFNAAGRYPNTMSGDSHAALYLDQTPQGIRVVDQWLGQPAHERIIRFRGGQGDAVNDGDRFWTIETA
ncbi:MAG TPA: BPSL0067 family protein [Acetobacteraceae bacterium]